MIITPHLGIGDLLIVKMKQISNNLDIDYININKGLILQYCENYEIKINFIINLIKLLFHYTKFDINNNPTDFHLMDKYKLITLPRGTAKLPILDLGYTSIVIKQGVSLAITPQTLNYLGGNTFESSGYTATISDVRLMQTFEGVGINTPQATSLNSTTTLGTNVSKTVVGTTINIRATTVNTLFGSNIALYATLTVEGRDSGARLTIPITVTKVS